MIIGITFIKIGHFKIDILIFYENQGKIQVGKSF